MRLLLLAAVLLAGCKQEAPPQAVDFAHRPEPAGSTATSVTIAIRGMQFVPETAEVAAGGTVTWKNEDLVEHTATASDKSFDSGKIKPGASWTYTAAKAGSVPYVCLLHPTMKGTLVVK